MTNGTDKQMSDQRIRNFADEANERLGAKSKSESMYTHQIKRRDPCDHQWNNGGQNPTHCLRCGISFGFCIFMECN